MSETLARHAAERALARRVDTVAALSGGRSSSAWLVTEGAEKWVVRVPVPDSGRRITYRAESLVGQYLAHRGHTVAQWATVDVDAVSCSVARYQSGTPVDDRPWSDNFAQDLAAVLQDLHAMPAAGGHRDVGDIHPIVSVDLSGSAVHRTPVRQTVTDSDDAMAFASIEDHVADLLDELSATN